MELQGKVAVVTGTAVGVGRAAAVRFSGRACNVVIKQPQRCGSQGSSRTLDSLITGYCR